MIGSLLLLILGLGLAGIAASIGVAAAAVWIGRTGRLLAPFVPRRDPSARGTLAAVLSGDSGILAASDEIEVVSGVLAFSDRPVGELMTPRTAVVAIPEGMLAAEAAH